MDLLIWQLADSAFPAGGFAHSAGLEAAMQHGEVTCRDDLEDFTCAVIRQAGYSALPLVTAAHAEPVDLAALDALCDAFLSNPVANRASRGQGQAFLTACTRSFRGRARDSNHRGHRDLTTHFTEVTENPLDSLKSSVSSGERSVHPRPPSFALTTDEFWRGHAGASAQTGDLGGSGVSIEELCHRVGRAELWGHYGPVFGAALSALEIDRRSTQRLFLFLTSRIVTSAAVRLGLVGTYEAQQMQAAMAGEIDRTIERCVNLRPCDIAHTAPLIDLFQSTHDRLYSRLFQS